MPASLRLENLHKRFRAIHAVKGVSLSVEKGEVLGFLGPNGAGKSTTMKMATGFLRPDAGRALICDIDVQLDPVGARRHLGYLPEGAPAYGEMTVKGFLKFIGEVRGLKGAALRQALDKVVERTRLESVWGQTIETLSKGYRRRVGLAQAILHEPDVLILDEPTDGLDPNQKHQVRQLIREMARDSAIIVSTHILEEVPAVCTRAVIIARGRIIADGTAEEIAAMAPGDTPSLEAAFRHLTLGGEDKNQPRAGDAAQAAAEAEKETAGEA
ncbi:ABC transporter ATP-binding protein [Thermopetrobacter sp. TC1]|uniref:ABC transporter ATP-binding protein n=1 Tax=Thermopetrobacter sp. TC1 TaxID=1495045 RepID=UPI0009DCEE84|nr:ATP-binding cassette domain-containing protein [Thermopetrobacter sp. TC1]